MQAAATNKSIKRKKMCSLTASKGFELLSDDLIIEILSWLPVKCLMRYKSVCKLWCMIIKSRKFIEKQLEQAKPHILVNPDSHSPQSQQPFVFLFSVDGLSLEQSKIHGYYRIRNNATNQVIVLPERICKRICASMSYIPSSQKYKVLSLHWGEGYADICLKVFYVGVDVTWRSVEVPITYCANKKHAIQSITVDRVSYIMKCCEIKCCQLQVIAFQAEDESFVEIPLPRRAEVVCYTGSRFRFIRWDNKLSLLCMFEGGLHIWALHDYKKAEWDESKIVYPSSVIKEYPYIKNLTPYAIHGNVAVMRIPDQPLQLCYDIESKQVLGVSNRYRTVRTSLVSLI